MGLTLRRYEDDPERLQSLRERIYKKYGRKGLHVAQFVQNGFFGKFLGNILERTSSPDNLGEEIQNFLNDIDRTVVFIKSGDNVDRRTEEIAIKIQAHNPKAFTICSSRSAMGKCAKVRVNVMRRISGYTHEMYKTEIKEIYFLNRLNNFS